MTYNPDRLRHLDILKTFPQRTTDDQLPQVWSVGRGEPNIILKNDGFRGAVVYPLEYMYIQIARMLAVKGEKHDVIGIAMQILPRENIESSIAFTVLHNPNDFMTKRRARGDGSPEQIPDAPIYNGNLPDGTPVTLRHEFADPMFFPPVPRNDPAVVVAYGTDLMIDRVHDRLNDTITPYPRTDHVTDTDISDAIKQATAYIAVATGIISP